jgi:RNA polymerase sigma-70 factor (ECF subfamily)
MHLGVSSADLSRQDPLETIYLEQERLIYATAGKYIQDEHDRQDIVQDTVLRLIQHKDVVTALDGCRLTAYIVFTVRSAAIDYLKRKNRWEQHTGQYPESDEDYPDPTAS